MRVELMNDRGNTLLYWAIPTLEKQLVKCLTHNYPAYILYIRLEGSVGFITHCVHKSDHKHNEEKLQKS
jgi:hypothetical protein